ncbi:MAG: ABC transporter ATP-binding protein [Nocardioides sp.]|jgi:ABC-2 type transport system ATP-binding protein
MATNAISVRSLTRTYGGGAAAFTAVRDLNLEVVPGTIHALLGVNGAGKTSTMEIIEGLASATSGEVRVLGLDPIEDRAAVRRRTGVLLQKSGFIGDLTVAETLEMWASTVSHPRPLDESMSMLNLTSRRDVAVRNLSGGEQRRLDLACTLMGGPELVMLDEPTTGLDPESRRAVWDLISALRDQGHTVLLTTHFLDEAEALADQVSIMRAGEIVVEGTVSQIVAGEPSTITFSTLDVQLPALQAEVHRDPSRTTIRTADLQPVLTTLLTWAERQGLTLVDLSVSSPSLEAVFLRIAQQGAHRTAHQSGILEGATR